MLDEYRGLLALGNQIMKFSEAETTIALLLTFKEQKRFRYKYNLEEPPKNKTKRLQEEYLSLEEAQSKLSQVQGYDVAIHFTRATMSRVKMKLEVLGKTIKKKPRVGYYIAELKRR